MYMYILSCSYIAISDWLSVMSDIGEDVKFLPSEEPCFETYFVLSDVTSYELKDENEYFVKKKNTHHLFTVSPESKK